VDCCDVAIVGGGCSGLLVAAQLFRQGFGGSVAIVEPRSALGRGLAYSTPYDDHLLNVPAGKMSALPSHPSHFLEWLRAGRIPEASPTCFAPRKVYGEYLSSLSKFGWREQHTIVFDHLVAPTAQYISREKFEEWWNGIDARETVINWHNRNSWRGFGRTA